MMDSRGKGVAMKTFNKVLAAVALSVGMAVGAAQASPIAVGGPWTILDETMTTGSFFHAPDGSIYWTFDCQSQHCKIVVTDLYVVSDKFEIYDNNVLLGVTSTVKDWDELGYGDPFESPPYTTDPDVALASGFFSSGIFYVGAGAHSISIKDIHIPPVGVGGAPFPDGTVAFKVTVPEPGTLALLGLAFAGLGLARRKRA
jgi:hypothetical protein